MGDVIDMKNDNIPVGEIYAPPSLYKYLTDRYPKREITTSIYINNNNFFYFGNNGKMYIIIDKTDMYLMEDFALIPIRG